MPAARPRALSWLAAAACAAAAGCGDTGGGGQVQRVENLQRCLTSEKKLPTNLTRDARLSGSDAPADLLDTELLSPSAARIYVFGSVDAAKSAETAAPGVVERRDNVVLVFAHEPTDADRKALGDCFSGSF